MQQAQSDLLDVKMRKVKGNVGSEKDREAEVDGANEAKEKMKERCSPRHHPSPTTH